MSASRDFWDDLVAFSSANRRHVLTAVITAVMLFTVAALIAQRANDKANGLQDNICLVLKQASAGNAVQHKFWSDAAARATQRAIAEPRDLAQLDLDAAAADRRIAAQYAASGIKFPGC